MAGILGAAYDWIKAVHIIFVIFWMAGLFIFPRYLVHHQEALGRPGEAAQWTDREAKLRMMILTPSLLATWVFGLLLGFSGDWWQFGWLHAKLVLVILLSGFHGWAVFYSRRLAKGQGSLSSRSLRMINELPALGVVGIVFLVVLKPF
jgi:protoporphyrinogen IX oxidase